MRTILLLILLGELLSNTFCVQLLVPLVSSYRYEGPEVNASLAKSEAKILHEKINEKAYGHEEIFRILTTRSKAQLLATFNDYNNGFGHPINKVFANVKLLKLSFSMFWFMLHFQYNIQGMKLGHVIEVQYFCWS